MQTGTLETAARRRALLAAALALATMAPAHGQAGAHAQPLILAVHPYLPAGELLTRFAPLARVLGQAVGRPMVVRVGGSYIEQIDAIGNDSVDLAYMGPAPYVNLVAKYGAKPLLGRQVVDGDPMLHGEFVVRQDSSIQTLKDLKGRRFAFGDPESTTSAVLPAAMLRSAGIPESALAGTRYLGSHKNVALAVLAGDYDAGAVKEEVFESYAPRGLRSIGALPAVPDHVIVASRKLPPAMVDALRAALLDLPKTPVGRSALAAIQTGLGSFVAARDSDYDGLRALIRKATPVGR